MNGLQLWPWGEKDRSSQGIENPGSELLENSAEDLLGTGGEQAEKALAPSGPGGRHGICNKLYTGRILYKKFYVAALLVNKTIYTKE